VKDNGIVPQYYGENSHQPIISSEIYMGQEEMARRANLRSREVKERVYNSE